MNVCLISREFPPFFGGGIGTYTVHWSRALAAAGHRVVVVTVVGAYVVLGIVAGNGAADDGRWAAAFLANVQFEKVGTNYLLSQQLPSPLQNYWSLSVEEQSYSGHHCNDRGYPSRT